jgi:hypothetical protein
MLASVTHTSRLQKSTSAQRADCPENRTPFERGGRRVPPQFNPVVCAVHAGKLAFAAPHLVGNAKPEHARIGTKGDSANVNKIPSPIMSRGGGIMHNPNDQVGASTAFFLEETSLFNPPKLNVFVNAGNSETLLQIEDYDLKFSTYEHMVSCNMFRQCISYYNCVAFIISKKTGEKIKLAAVETAVAVQDEVTPIDWEPANSGYRNDYKDVTDFYIGIGHPDKRGGFTGSKWERDPDYWGVAKCFFYNGEIITWRWHSHR